MTTLHNHITINASPESVWRVLSDLGRLEKYDPIVTNSRLIEKATSGLGAKRHCHTANGWFKEEVSEWQPHQKLSFTLFDCNLPMKALKHSYHLEQVGMATKISQTMTYTMKYRILGRVMDVLIVRKQSNRGIRLFFEGLKKEVENENNTDHGV
ncbi:MAG: SRPBCC family protein [Roseivirga sp.]|nr:SRPBCC family protein [Roseivirga sp.]